MKKYFSLTVFISLITLFLFVTHLSAESQLPLPDIEPDISMDFQDANLKDVLKALSIQSGLNFVASQTVQDRKITLYMDKVPLRQAMDKIFIANNLSYEMDRDSNVFIVKDWGKQSIELVTKVFYLKYATVMTSSIKEEQSNLIRSTSQTTTTTSISGSSGESGKWKNDEDAGITLAVKKLLTPNNVGQVVEDFRTNSLIVTDTPRNMATIADVIAALDIPVQQVMLEIEMLDVSKNALEKLGVKWGDLNSHMFVASFTGGSFDTSFPLLYKNVASAFLPGSVSFKQTNPYTVAIDFLRQYTDTKVLARPKIMTLNNETAEIKITTNEAIGTITNIQTGSLAPVTTTSAERVETGVSLRVTPQINSDTGEITMVVLPSVKDATVSLFDPQFKDPEERSTKSVVKIKDGETVVIGGLIRNDRSSVESKLPIFGDLPLVGGLFRHKNVDKDRERELLVFITPHIVGDSKNIKLAQTKKISLPDREQTASGYKREFEINSALSGFDKK